MTLNCSKSTSTCSGGPFFPSDGSSAGDGVSDPWSIALASFPECSASMEVAAEVVGSQRDAIRHSVPTTATRKSRTVIRTRITEDDRRTTTSSGVAWASVSSAVWSGIPLDPMSVTLRRVEHWYRPVLDARQGQNSLVLPRWEYSLRRPHVPLDADKISGYAGCGTQRPHNLAPPNGSHRPRSPNLQGGLSRPSFVRDGLEWPFLRRHCPAYFFTRFQLAVESRLGGGIICLACW